jgi:hypothetical protein
MLSEIKRIHYVLKRGVYGTEKIGEWLYGYRPDGRSVGCKLRHEGGFVEVYSTWRPEGSKKDEECITQFTRDEWDFFKSTKQDQQEVVCGVILSARSNPEILSLLDFHLSRRRIQREKKSKESEEE